jgi:hypothetical protein
VFERLGEVLLAEGELANGPDLGILSANDEVSISVITQHGRAEIHAAEGELTGLSVFLISISNTPPFRAMISGAASGSWARAEPQSSQNQRHTALPEEPMPFHFFTGPLIVSLSFGTTHTSASSC